MKRFKVVCAGCGGQSILWLNYALKRSDTEIVALVDIDDTKAKNAARILNLNCKTFNNTAVAIKNTGANLVFNLTTPGAHRDVIIDSLSNHCDVFSEKPLGENWEHVLQIARVAAQSDRKLSVMQNRRYLKGIRALNDIVTSGVIGDITFIGIDFFLYPLGSDHWDSYRTKIEHPLINDMSIHTFDMARFLSQDLVPISAYCHEFQPKGSLYRGKPAAVCIFEMSDGSVVDYRGHWCSEGCSTPWESKWRLTGVKGTAEWDGINKPYFEIPMPEEEKKLGYKASRYKRAVAEYEWVVEGDEYTGSLEACINEMFNSLLDNRKSETDWTDNIQSMAMVCAAVKSAEESRKVMVSELTHDLLLSR